MICTAVHGVTKSPTWLSDWTDWLTEDIMSMQDVPHAIVQMDKEALLKCVFLTPICPIVSSLCTQLGYQTHKPTL